MFIKIAVLSLIARCMKISVAGLQKISSNQKTCDLEV